MEKKAKIFISSTIYDFRYLRQALKYNLERLNFDVQCSERPDFDGIISDENKSSYDICLDNISQCQYFVLLLGGRIGGYYNKNNQTSITRAEYEKAYSLSMQSKLKILCFVDAEILAIQKFCKNKDIRALPDEKQLMIEEPHDVLFKFIDDVCRKSEMIKASKIGEDFPVNNWVISFNDFTDIIRTLEKYLFSSISENINGMFVKYADQIFQEHTLKGFVWGKNMTVLRCPKIDWWKTTDIRFDFLNNEYSIVDELWRYDRSLNADKLRSDFQNYSDNIFPKTNSENKDRLMLVNRPTSFSDNAGLIIELRKTNWKTLQYFWHTLMTESKRKSYVDDYFNGEAVCFPNSVCLHLVILTNNGKVLLTRNNPTKNDKKGWAVTLGEQLSLEDIEIPDEDCAAKWIQRALEEELGIDKRDNFYDIDKARFVALNLEGDMPNLTLCCVLQLNVNDDRLLDKIRSNERIDYEFLEVGFIDIDDIPSEMLEITRLYSPYHPSSHIRMAYAYMFQRSYKELILALHNLYKNKTRYT